MLLLSQLMEDSSFLNMTTGSKLLVLTLLVLQLLEQVSMALTSSWWQALTDPKSHGVLVMVLPQSALDLVTQPLHIMLQIVHWPQEIITLLLASTAMAMDGTEAILWLVIKRYVMKPHLSPLRLRALLMLNVQAMMRPILALRMVVSEHTMPVVPKLNGLLPSLTIQLWMLPTSQKQVN